jgi:flagellar FliL protein
MAFAESTYEVCVEHVRAAHTGAGLMAKKKDDLNLGKDTGAQDSGGGKGKLIIIVVVVLLLGGGAAAYFLLPGGAAPQESDVQAGAVEAAPKKEPLYMDVQKLLVNLEHNGKTHYVQAEMQLMSYDQAVIDQAYRDRPAIRDRLIMLFNRQDFDALKTVEGKEALRAAALATVNEALDTQPPAVVEEVYFENFVLQ